jgi:superoxide reductase
MAEVGEVYVCEICGNKVKVLAGGEGELVCCGQPMNKVAG